MEVVAHKTTKCVGAGYWAGPGLSPHGLAESRGGPGGHARRALARPGRRRSFPPKRLEPALRVVVLPWVGPLRPSGAKLGGRERVGWQAGRSGVSVSGDRGPWGGTAAAGGRAWVPGHGARPSARSRIPPRSASPTSTASTRSRSIHAPPPSVFSRSRLSLP